MDSIENGNKNYIQQALISLQQITQNSQLDMMERMNRVNKGEIFVLHFLTMKNAAVLPSELSTALGSSTGRMSALLGTLEKKGQIERDIDRSNRRNILVTITEAGRGRAEMEMAKMKNSMTQIFTEMGEADTIEFVRLAGRFFAISQKYMVECGKDGGGVHSE